MSCPYRDDDSNTQPTCASSWEGWGGNEVGGGVSEGRTVTHHQEAGLQLLKHLVSSQQPTAELLEVNNCTVCTATHTETADRTKIYRTGAGFCGWFQRVSGPRPVSGPATLARLARVPRRNFARRHRVGGTFVDAVHDGDAVVFSVQEGRLLEKHLHLDTQEETGTRTSCVSVTLVWFFFHQIKAIFLKNILHNGDSQASPLTGAKHVYHISRNISSHATPSATSADVSFRPI